MSVDVEIQTTDLINLQEKDRRFMIIEEPNNINIDETKLIKINKSHIEYYQNFKNKHKDDINKKCVCEICGGSFTYYNKSSHLKTKKCQTVKQLRNL